MVTAYELERLRKRIERIERDLVEARFELSALEDRAGAVAEPAQVNEVAREAAALEVVEGLVETERVVTPAEAFEKMPEAAAPSASPPPLPLPPPLPPAHAAVAASPSRVARVERPPVADAASPLRGWLERLQLWPPAAGEGNAEARLGAWWATRVGALLAVTGVVFFGVYISLHTPPWVKFCELLAVAVGVSALGAWLERRLPAFGAVVFAGGLALIFFTAYAGHVAAAVRVFDSMWASVFWQGVAVALIVGVALRRRSPLIATMAIGLGHVTAVFSGRGGFDGFALGAAALLGLVAVALRRARGWEAPSVVAMPAGYAVFALTLAAAERGDGAGLPFPSWVFLAGMAALYFLRDWRREPVEAGAVTAGEKWFQNANASFAVLAAWATALGWYRAQLGEFYLVLATVLAVAAWTRARQVRGGDAVAAVLMAKAAGALTLGVIELADARTVAVALLVQAAVLTWTARRLASRVLAVGAGLAAALATRFFFEHAPASAPVWSAGAAQAVLFVLGLCAWATEAGRALVHDAGRRRTLEILAAGAAGAGALLIAQRWTPSEWAPAYAMALGLLFVAVAVARRGRAAAWVAAGLALAANAWLWIATARTDPTGSLGWNLLAVLAPTVAAGAWLGRREGAGWRAGGTLAWALAVIGAVLGAYALLPDHVALVTVLVAATALGWAAPVAPTRHLPWLATLGGFLGAWSALNHLGGGAVLGWTAAAALAAWALPVGLRAWARADAARRAERMPETMERVQVLVATFLAMRAMLVWLEGAELVGGLALLACAVGGLALRPGVRPALAASWVMWFAAWGALWFYPGEAGAGRGVLAALLAWAPVWLWTRAPARWTVEFTGWRRHAVAVQCAGATVLGLSAAKQLFAGADEIFALAGLAVVAALSHRPGRAGAARGGAVLVAVALGWSALGLIVGGDARGWGAGLGAVAVAAGVLAGLPLWLDRAKRRGGRFAGGGAALALMFLGCAAQRGGLANFATLGWGVTAITLFMVGLFWRIAPYRVLGLAGLALCVPRVFLVDLDSTLHRIAAFIVTGVVMLWVGFSYHRFRHLVTENPATPDKPSSPYS